MSSATVPVNWKQPEQQILVDMFRVDNRDIPLTPEMLIFGTPEPIDLSPDFTQNTSIFMRASETAPFVGSGTHEYHRVPIQDFVYPNVTSLEFVLENYSNVDELVEELSLRLDVYLDPAVVEFTYPSQPGSYVLLIKATSLVFLGGLELEFIHRQYDLDEVITVTNVSGFVY